MIARQIAASVTALMLAMTPALAQDETGPSSMGEKPIWVRYPAIAPDGETLSFTYRGRIFVVDAEGGLAVPLTANGTYSYGAIWSADSEKLAFASDLNGDDDVYVTDFSGTLERLTWSSTNEVPTSFSPDGQSLLYTALRLGDAEQSVQGPLSEKPQLYAVDTQTGRESLVLPNLAQQAQWNREQTKLVYTYNPSGDPDDRQHRVAPNARQIWTYDKVTGAHEPVFDVDGVDRHNPNWSVDGQTIYYLSEKSGWLNVWSLDVAAGTETQLTQFEGDPVRDLSVADDGTLAFSNRGRIYVQKPGSTEAKAIEVLTLEQRASRRDNLYAGTTQDFASSPDGELFSLVANADVFVQDSAGNFRQVTATPGQERDIVFSPDGAMLAYAALRDHQWGIYAVALKGEDDQSGLAPSYEEIPLYVPQEGNAYVPRFSPDGTKLAFVADRREIQVLDLASGDVTKLYGEGDYFSQYRDGVMNFAWSPNSQDLLVPWRAMDGSESHRVAIVPADGSRRAQPIGSVPNLFGAQWSLDGTQIFGATTLYGLRNSQLHSYGSDLYRVFVSEEARQDFLETASGAPAELDVAEDGTSIARRYDMDQYRAARLEGRLTEGQAGFMATWPLPDLQNLLGVSAAGGDSFVLETISLADGSVTLIGSFEAPGLQALSFVSEQGVLDARIDGAILRVPLAAPDQIAMISSRLFYARDADSARIAAFEQAWADANYRYYDPEHEGRDWDAIGAKYRAYLSSIASDRELRELISAMYGELSASHMFTGYRGMEAARRDMGNNNDALGVYIDHGYDGPGRRVAAILPGGPLDRRSIDIAPGDVIVSINGRDVPEAGGLDRLLDLNVGRPALVGVRDVETDEERFYTVKPIDPSAEMTLARTRLIDARREMVARLTNSCVAYEYLSDMYERNYLGLLGTLSAQRGVARATLIDVRSNGGGNLTRELITLLTGEVYSSVGRDDGPTDVEPNNRWVWPSAVLVDSFGYSDGSVFPQAYQDNAIGPLVGDIVLNTGTAVDYVESAVVPGLVYGLPVLPNRRMDGSYYENHVIEPDLYVPFDPNTVGINTDPQLEAALELLMEQIGADSDCRL
ncbi:MAG: PD40 domain-containing protein [Devosia sp.]|uniref:S41 family peptidase n=1 Tax=Devosia sp. TaxID=1871048 RepID=UPI0019FFB357|nr:S41 family peptidase [Devosia sp.]MBF0680456.1 PD40 domain-containing protein [Devosia sp.]